MPARLPACLQGPQLLIVVPTRELGVQLVMLVYRLYGGSVNQGVPGLAGNMFEFQGPRGLKVGGRCWGCGGGVAVGGWVGGWAAGWAVGRSVGCNRWPGLVWKHYRRNMLLPLLACPCSPPACLPAWLQVKGLLLESEVELAKKEYYLKGAHVVVGECAGLG